MIKEKRTISGEKVKEFVERLKQEGSKERELTAAFLSHVADLTNEYAQNMSAFLKQNQDIVAILGFSVSLGAGCVQVDKTLPIEMGLGTAPELVAMKLAADLLQIIKEVDK